jgi:HK97 family phage portal protein
MGLLARMSTTVAPARMRAAFGDLGDDRSYMPMQWHGQLTAAGVHVSPDLALTLSAVWRAVSGICGDFSPLPCQIFEYLDEEGAKIRARRHSLAYQLRWQPNVAMTAQQFFGMTVGHMLLRGNAYWELAAGPRGFADQIMPRHPDRVRKERLPSGRPRYRLIGGGTEPGTDRFLSADEMVHVPDLLTFDGWLGASRIAYGMQSFGGMLATEQASQTFFSSGFMAGVVATHKGGELDEEELKNIHTSLSLHAAGAKNNGGILIVEEDMTIQALGVDPEKAQLLATQQNAVKHVARWFGYPGHKLEVESQTQAYAAREQANLEYVMGCLRPIAICIEQVIQKDLILDQDRYFSEFMLEALFRGDLKTQGAFYKEMIRNRVYSPNEVRRKMNENPYEGGDEYCPWNTASAADNGSKARGRNPNGGNGDGAKPVGRGQSAGVRATVLAYEAAQRIVRKEIAAVTNLAKKHANDPDGWKAGLQAFYEDHAAFVSQALKLSMPDAREYAAEHGLVLAERGVSAMEGWEHAVSAELAQWALEGNRAA